ncbi:hypothetical protein ABB37_03941 [Leptomonas pyrrhocoris]|uniref:Uncharacterized protein n=1 Tax=Leptomonas pyrrhocoris TaxID=157538 RepID=A0A0N0VFV3_LEPPY|nr:hypothetical protein ABB37_03941 [Leptomonas pyrrhocoris]KPA81608.1 hypothetical protein ABB37_03941 [Leptomonas pyrrhocoris]|eukprot:XP_015660047.1 hypothetical protein ABB37_03941 [Leptomonas pyrrhocoris]
MSVLDDIVDAPMSITGEMWFCADSEQPTKTGAGRGAKHFISIEDDCCVVYTSRNEKSKPMKEIHFRSMKRATWFAHHPKPSPFGSKSAAGGTTTRWGAAKDSPKPLCYYYLVLEFVRDSAIRVNTNLNKRDHIVLCTEDKQDFDIWKKFTDLYESTPAPATAVRTHPAAADADKKEAFSSDGDDGDHYGRRALELWRNRCVALLNDFAHLSDPSLQVKSGEEFEDSNGQTRLDWDARAEAVVRAVERDMRPALKVLPTSALDAPALQSLSTVTSAAASPDASAVRGTNVDDLRSQMSHIKVEMEQFQAAAAELGAYVEGREVPAQTTSPDTLRGYLARLQHSSSSTNARTVTQQVGKGQSTPLPTINAVPSPSLNGELEHACQKAVQVFTDCVNSGSLALEKESSREQAIQQERASLPQRIDVVFAVILDELSCARDTTAKLKASLDDRSASSSVLPTALSLEMNELRKTLNRKELELETAQRQLFDENRRARQLSRCFEAAAQLYGEAAHDMLRSQYREYLSLHHLFLSALRGHGLPDSTAVVDTASHVASPSSARSGEGRRSELAMTSRGSSKLVVSAAHLEAVMALEKERQAAKVKQQRLEDVITELNALRRESDAEILNMRANFLAAKEAWARDLAVLQAKLAALQSSIPRGTVVLPATAPDATAVAALTERLKANAASTALAAQGDGSTQNAEAQATLKDSSHPATLAAPQDALEKAAAKLAVAPNESNVDAGALSQRFQAFYEWALSTVVPLTATDASQDSLLEMITKVVQAYHEILQRTSSIFGHPSPASDEATMDVFSRMKEEHMLFTRLCNAIQVELLSPAAELQKQYQHGFGAAHSTVKNPIPQLHLPVTNRQLDELEPYLSNINSDVQSYRRVIAVYNTTDIFSLLQQLTDRSTQLDNEPAKGAAHELQLKDCQQQLSENKAHENRQSEHIANALAALGVEAASDEPVGAAVARAAAAAAERERALEAELAATRAAASEAQEKLVAERDASLRAAGERLAETDAARRELSDGVADALAALGVEAASDEPVGAAVARAAAAAAERERALEAELAATRAAASEAQEKLVAERDASLRAAGERLAETDAARRELSDGVADALAALGVEAASDEPVGAAVARAAAGARCSRRGGRVRRAGRCRRGARRCRRC